MRKYGCFYYSTGTVVSGLMYSLFFNCTAFSPFQFYFKTLCVYKLKQKELPSLLRVQRSKIQSYITVLAR